MSRAVTGDVVKLKPQANIYTVLVAVPWSMDRIADNASKELRLVGRREQAQELRTTLGFRRASLGKGWRAVRNCRL